MDARSYIIAILEDGINGVFMCPPILGLYDMSVEELLVEWKKQTEYIRVSFTAPIIPLLPKMDGDVRKIPRFTDNCPKISKEEVASKKEAVYADLIRALEKAEKKLDEWLISHVTRKTDEQ